jgi:pimeloyl-ACP methyl ester carboxylesterase
MLKVLCSSDVNAGKRRSAGSSQPSLVGMFLGRRGPRQRCASTSCNERNAVVPSYSALPSYSHLIAGLLPHATVKIYPDAAHGFLFQHHAEFAADVTEFLG